MTVFLDTRGRSTLAIGVCGRCSQKFPLGDLHPDPNFPGLLVCRKDIDHFDPYRLPARQTENIALRYARPDTPLDGFAVVLPGATGWILTTGLWDDSGLWDDTALWQDGPFSFSLMGDE